jgi:hypothetical protein
VARLCKQVPPALTVVLVMIVAGMMGHLPWPVTISIQYTMLVRILK